MGRVLVRQACIASFGVGKTRQNQGRRGEAERFLFSVLWSIGMEESTTQHGGGGRSYELPKGVIPSAKKTARPVGAHCNNSFKR